MLFGILLVLFIFVCILLCLIVLIQSDKGGGISGAVGGGLSGASSFLGTQDTANILTKGTAIFGGAFLVLCIIMTIVASGGRGSDMAKSAMQRRAEKNQSLAPTPAPGASLDLLEGDGTEVLPGLIKEDVPPEGSVKDEPVKDEPVKSPEE